MATQKIIACPKCKAKLKFDPDKIVAEVVKFKCPNCQVVLRIRKPAVRQEPPPAPASEFSTPDTGPTPERQAPESTDPAPKQDEKISFSDDLSEIPRGSESAFVPATPPAEELPGPGPVQASEIQETELPEPLPKQDEKISFTDDLSETLRDSEAASPLSEPDGEDKISASPEAFPEKTQDFIPDYKRAASSQSGDSIIEDYFHENLKEYEEGEAEEGDLEWTRYADKKGRELPESRIDLNVLPAAAAELQETLADLHQAEVYNLQGENHLDKNLVRQAIRDFNNALEINPDYVDALVNRGSALVLQDDFNGAMRDFNRALDLEKKEPEIYKIRGEIYLLNRMYDEAIKDFTAAIILNPMYSDAYLNRARAYSEKGMQDEADSDFNQAIKADPDKFDDFAGLEGAEALFNEDDLSNKDKAARLMQLGLESLKRENYYEALESFTNAIDLSHHDALPYIYRGQTYVELGQPDEAMVDLNRAVIYDPLNPVLYYWRAKAWKAMDSQLNMLSDLKLSCELGYVPACEEYSGNKPQKH